MKTKFALSVAIVLCTASTTLAAPKHKNVTAQRSGPRAQATVPRTVPFSNPNSPEATGGGSLGYNQRIYRW
jgi:hypothetical protein